MTMVAFFVGKSTQYTMDSVSLGNDPTHSERPPMSGPGLMLVQGWSGRHAARAGTNTSGAGAL